MNDRSGQRMRDHSGPLVVIVGPCASGKSTLAKNLEEHGVRTHVVGQEHSAIKRLWQRRQPDFVVALDVDLETLRRRRGATWPADLYRLQHERLADAFSAASITIDTSDVPELDVVSMVLETLGQEKHDE